MCWRRRCWGIEIRKRLKIFALKLWDWFSRSKPVWVLLMYLAGTFLVAGFIGNAWCISLTKIGGSCLELVGVYYVAKQINNRREVFGKLKLQNGIWNWIKEFPELFKSPKPVTLHFSGFDCSDTLFAHATLSHSAAETTLESRLAAAELNIQILKGSVSDLRSELEQRAKKIEDEIRNESAALANTIENAKAQVEKINVHGSEYDLIGVIFVAIGSLAANVNWNWGYSQACLFVLQQN
jgi:hypothetical protein